MLVRAIFSSGAVTSAKFLRVSCDFLEVEDYERPPGTVYEIDCVV